MENVVGLVSDSQLVIRLSSREFVVAVKSSCVVVVTSGEEASVVMAMMSHRDL
jgi:hypothetical protein